MRRRGGYADQLAALLGESGMIGKLDTMSRDPESPLGRVATLSRAVSQHGSHGKTIAPGGMLDRVLHESLVLEESVHQAAGLEEPVEHAVGSGDPIERTVLGHQPLEQAVVEEQPFQRPSGASRSAAPALDPFQSYKTAIDDNLEDAVAVLDAFHIGFRVTRSGRVAHCPHRR